MCDSIPATQAHPVCVPDLKNVWKNIIIPDLIKSNPNDVYTLREVNWFFNQLISPLEITRLLFKLIKTQSPPTTVDNIFQLLVACFNKSKMIWSANIFFDNILGIWLEKVDFFNKNKILPAFLYSEQRNRILSKQCRGMGMHPSMYYPPLASAVCKILETQEDPLKKRLLITYCSWPLAKEIFKKQILDTNTFKNLYVNDRFCLTSMDNYQQEYLWIVKNCPKYQPILCNDPNLHRCSPPHHCPGCKQFNPDKWERIYCEQKGCTECFKGCRECSIDWQKKHNHYFVKKCLGVSCENKKRMPEHQQYHCSCKYLNV